MAPKGKSAAAKAKGAAKCKAASKKAPTKAPRAERAPVTVASAESADIIAAPAKGGAAAAKANAVQHAVARLLRLKFAHVASTRLATAVNEHGESLEHVIAAEVRRTSLSGEYIKATFWNDVEEAFKLRCGDWEALEEPGEAIAELDPFDTQLPGIMGMILGDNPAMKSKGLDRLEAHLDSCDKLPLRQVYGLLTESCESSKLQRTLSFRFQWCMLRYVVKHEVQSMLGTRAATKVDVLQHTSGTFHSRGNLRNRYDVPRSRSRDPSVGHGFSASLWFLVSSLRTKHVWNRCSFQPNSWPICGSWDSSVFQVLHTILRHYLSNSDRTCRALLTNS